MNAALMAFRERGYHETTLSDIADRLGVRKTALYHYYPDKEAILYRCHVESLKELDRIVAQASECDSAIDQLRVVITEHVRLMTATLQGAPISFEVGRLTPKHQRKVIAGRDRYDGALRNIIVRGIERGELHRVDPKIASFALLGAINWIARWYRPEGSSSSAELSEGFADVLLSGLERR